MSTGTFELNVMMPVMAYDLLGAIELLAAGSRNFAEKLVDGLEADRARAEGFVEQVAREKSGIPEERLNQLLDPRSQVG
jgi:fumarate hydratase class II